MSVFVFSYLLIGFFFSSSLHLYIYIPDEFSEMSAKKGKRKSADSDESDLEFTAGKKRRKDKYENNFFLFFFFPRHT